LDRLNRILAPVAAEVAFAQVARKLTVRAKLFDELRPVLRLDDAASASPSPNVINGTEQPAALEDLERSFTDFCRSLRERRDLSGPDSNERQMLDLVLRHVDRHGRHLWDHVIRLPDEAGGGIRLVARTNNLLENFFHQMKHGERRRSGRKVLTQDFEGLPAAAALAYNLARADYVELVCGSLDKLPGRFSMPDLARKEAMLAGKDISPIVSAPATAVSTALPLPDRRLVRRSALGNFINSVAHK
jgi:hypothetical protein